MTRWERTLAALSRTLTVRATGATRQLAGRSGIPGPEDLAQEVIARLLRTYGEEELRTWTRTRLTGVAARALHNQVVDLARRRPLELPQQNEAQGAALEDVVPGHGPDPEELTAAREMLHIFTGCFRSVLDETERRFVTLSFELDSAPKAQEALRWPRGMHDKTKVCHLRRRLLQRVMRCVDRKTAGSGTGGGTG